MGTKGYDYDASVRYLIENYQLKDGFKTAMELLNGGKDKIPEDIKDPTDLMGNGFDYGHTIGAAREAYITKYGFVIVTKRMARELAGVIGQDKCLEVMSGTGYLAMALQQQGANVIATDNHSWKETVFHTVDPWTEIENIDAVMAIKSYMTDPEVRWVLMSWPPYNKPIAANVLRFMEDVNKNYRPDNPLNLIYLGEDMGGCTADDDFFIMLDRHVEEDEERQRTLLWKLDHDFLYQAMYGVDDGDDGDGAGGFYRQFNGIHDWPFVYRWAGSRKNKGEKDV